MAGLFGLLFGESSSETHDDEVSTQEQHPSTHVTGVEKYLQNQKPVTTATGVAKYLKVKKQQTPSGVAKYLAKQVIIAKNKLEAEVSVVEVKTGVEQYLHSHESKPPTKVSSVAKYLASHESSVSGVAKYMARKIIAARNAPPILKTTGVALYLENRKEILVTGVGKYMAKQVLVAKKIATETVAVVEATVTTPLDSATGVEKYLQAKT